MSPYAELSERFARIAVLEEAAAVLGWDAAVIMSEAAAEARGEQLAALEATERALLTDPETTVLLGRASEDAAAAGTALDPWVRANLTEMAHRHRRAVAVPDDLAAALTRATTVTEVAWRQARQDDDFATLAPMLGQVVDLVRQQAQALADALDLTPYDALLDGYDPGLTATGFEGHFDRLAAEVPPLLETAIDGQGPVPEPAAGTVSAAAQETLARRVMTALGFDFTRGRLDTSTHPFSGGTPNDIRITTRWDETDPLSGLMAVCHETGHALYEAGLPEAWRRQPVGRARGMTLHESQSLLIEMQLCRDDAFLSWLAPILAETLDVDGPAWTAAGLGARLRRVAKGDIRVDADEVSYPLHVILRTRLERDLIGGGLTVTDLPDAWRAASTDLFGRAPDTDRDGCLQDIHWPAGAFGYFPTYTLGAMAAAQLFAALRRDDPALSDQVAKGNLTVVRAWAGQTVHGRASSASTEAIVAEATGAPLGTDAFLAHLKDRYL